MPITIDLGGAPAEEDCAQLGQTDDFARINQLEVLALPRGPDRPVRPSRPMAAP